MQINIISIWYCVIMHNYLTHLTKQTYKKVGKYFGLLPFFTFRFNRKNTDCLFETCVKLGLKCRDKTSYKNIPRHFILSSLNDVICICEIVLCIYTVSSIVRKLTNIVFVYENLHLLPLNLLTYHLF